MSLCVFIQNKLTRIAKVSRFKLEDYNISSLILLHLCSSRHLVSLLVPVIIAPIVVVCLTLDMYQVVDLIALHDPLEMFYDAA